MGTEIDTVTECFSTTERDTECVFEYFSTMEREGESLALCPFSILILSKFEVSSMFTPEKRQIIRILKNVSVHPKLIFFFFVSHNIIHKESDGAAHSLYPFLLVQRNTMKISGQVLHTADSITCPQRPNAVMTGRLTGKEIFRFILKSG